MPVGPHFLMELHLSLCAAVPDVRWIEYIPQIDSLTEKPMQIENGQAVPSNEPGFGIAWDINAIARQTVPGSKIGLR